MVAAGTAWSLIPIHAVLLGDGRVLTYGTDENGKQTGYFCYDVWNSGYNASNPGLSPQVPDLSPESHLLLPNATATDLFCSAQIVLPRSGDNAKVLLAGGDIWTGTNTTNGPNNNSNLFLIIRFTHPAMMTRYGCGAVAAQAYARRSVRLSS